GGEPGVALSTVIAASTVIARSAATKQSSFLVAAKEAGLLRFARNDGIACGVPHIGTSANFPSSILSTGYLPVSSSARLPAFPMRVPEKQRSLACSIGATPVNSAAT